MAEASAAWAGPVVCIAASAGGVRALLLLLADLPADFGAPVLIVQHLQASRPSMLAEVLGRRTALDVRFGVDKDPIRPGCVYLAPPDANMGLTGAGRIDLGDLRRLSYVRPSADVLFQAIADACGPRAIAVVLSGMGRDGSQGVADVKRAGGTVIVEDPATASFPSMPRSAEATHCADHVLALPDIAATLMRLVEGWNGEQRAG